MKPKYLSLSLSVSGVWSPPRQLAVRRGPCALDWVVWCVWAVSGWVGATFNRGHGESDRGERGHKDVCVSVRVSALYDRGTLLSGGSTKKGE